MTWILPPCWTVSLVLLAIGLMKLWVLPVSINTITGCRPRLPFTLIVWGKTAPKLAWRDISRCSSISLNNCCFVNASVVSTPGSLSSPSVWEPLRTYNTCILQRWPYEYFSVQSEQSPFSLRSFISASDSFLTRSRGFRLFPKFFGNATLLLSIWWILRFAQIFSSCNRAWLVATDRDVGRNICTPNQIFSVRLAMKRLIMNCSFNPSILLARFSNWFWHSCTVELWRSLSNHWVLG